MSETTVPLSVHLSRMLPAPTVGNHPEHQHASGAEAGGGRVKLRGGVVAIAGRVRKGGRAALKRDAVRDGGHRELRSIMHDTRVPRALFCMTVRALLRL